MIDGDSPIMKNGCEMCGGKIVNLVVYNIVDEGRDDSGCEECIHGADFFKIGTFLLLKINQILSSERRKLSQNHIIYLGATKGNHTANIRVKLEGERIAFVV